MSLAQIRALFSSKPKRVEQTPAQLEHLLRDRSTAEIVARLLRRAELHLAPGADSYLPRCSALDCVAAENMMRLEQKAGTDMVEWRGRRDLCLRLLREGKN